MPCRAFFKHLPKPSLFLGFALANLTTSTVVLTTLMPAIAQTLNSKPRFPPIPPTQSPSTDQLLKLPNLPGEISTPDQIPDRVTVTKFKVEGSTIFSDQELEIITAPYTNHPITFAELLQARTAVTQFYVDRGYITTGAIIPPQSFSANGAVIIQVIEGGLEEIQVRGTNRLQPDYVRSRLEIATQSPLNRDRLIGALQMLQLNPLIANLSAELSTGTQPGLNLLEVNVTEAPSFSGGLTLDNRRSPSVGSDRRQVEIREGNLLGWGDSLVLAYTHTEGSNAYDFSYTLPVSPSNTTLSFAYGNSNSRVIENPFNEIDIIAASRSYEITLRQPLGQTPNSEFALGLTGSHRQSETALLDTPFPLSPGADSQGKTRVSALCFFQELTQRSSQEVLALRSQLSWGFNSLNATINPEPPDGRFVSWRGQAQYANQFATDTLLLLRGDLQLSDRPLVPIEQIGIGGMESVRGYRQDLLLADNGLVLNAEVRLPILRVPEWKGLLQVIPFADFGAAWNSSGRTNSNSNSIFGVGLGLRWQQGNNLTLRIDYGIPLNNSSASRKSLQENGLYFSLNWNAF